MQVWQHRSADDLLSLATRFRFNILSHSSCKLQDPLGFRILLETPVVKKTQMLILIFNASKKCNPAISGNRLQTTTPFSSLVPDASIPRPTALLYGVCLIAMEYYFVFIHDINGIESCMWDTYLFTVYDRKVQALIL